VKIEVLYFQGCPHHAAAVERVKESLRQEGLRAAGVEEIEVPDAERARQRGTDENVPQALAGYRPQIVASLSAGLQAVRNLLPDNTVQGATLRPLTIGARPSVDHSR